MHCQKPRGKSAWISQIPYHKITVHTLNHLKIEFDILSEINLATGIANA